MVAATSRRFWLHVVVVIVGNLQEIRALPRACRRSAAKISSQEERETCCAAGAEEFVNGSEPTASASPRAVEHHTEVSLLLISAWLCTSPTVRDFHLRQALEVQDTGVEQQPRQHLVIGHRLRDVIDGVEPTAPASLRSGSKSGSQFLPASSRKYSRLPPTPWIAGNFQLARPDRLVEGPCLQRLRPLHGKPASSTSSAMAQTPGPCVT